MHVCIYIKNWIGEKMNKNIEFSHAMEFLRNKVKVDVVNCLAASFKKEGINVDPNTLHKLSTILESEINASVVGCSGAFNSLLK